VNFKKLIPLVLAITFSIVNYAQTHQSIFHEVKVQEILQVKSYTYLFVEEGTSKKWLAVPSFEAKVGETYFYKGGMPMSNFKSKELNKTFESVLFLSDIYKNPIDKEDTTFKHSTNIESKKVTPSINKKLTLSLERTNGEVSIADLLKNKETYEGKTVKIKGKVTKFNSQVMSKNWIHLQDGSEYNGDFDLTITTNAEAKVGDIITIEGTVYLNKDFGYGYLYAVIIENAVLVK